MDVVKRALALLDDMGKPAVAEQELRRHLAEQPDDAFALTVLARALGEQQCFAEAEEVIAKALHLAPTVSYTQRIRGWLHLLQDQDEQAEAAFREALRLDPTEIEALIPLSTLLRLQGKHQEALTIAEQGLALESDNVACLNCRATALVELGRLAEARAVLEEALRRDPTNAHTHVNRGWLREKQGRPIQALRCYRTALEVNPQSARAKVRLLELLWKASQRLESVTLIIYALIVIPVLLFDQFAPVGRNFGRAKLMCVIGLVGGWVAVQIRHNTFFLGCLSLTPYGRLVLTATQARRVRLYIGIIGLTLLAAACALLSFHDLRVGWLTLGIIYIAAVPLLLALPGPEGGGMVARVPRVAGLAAIGAVALAVHILLPYFYSLLVGMVYAFTVLRLRKRFGWDTEADELLGLTTVAPT